MSGPFKRHDQEEEEYESLADRKASYREEQQALRDAGWDAYNSDYVDEFPSW